VRLTTRSSPPRVRWRASTTPQGLPRHRLPIRPSQHVSVPVPATTLASSRRSHLNHVAYPAFAAFGGLDWAAAEHEGCLHAAGATTREGFRLEPTPEAITAWVSMRRTRFNGQPVALCLELDTGPLGSALRQ
jgi:hypothetical protein